MCKARMRAGSVVHEDGNSVFLDLYVVSDYLDSHINNTRTSFKIPECNEGFEEGSIRRMPWMRY
jgi:hypothetical protein